MSYIARINGFSYNSLLFDALAEASRLNEIAKSDVVWVAKWKLGQRAAWYRASAQSQRQKEHEIFNWVNSTATCSCGLMFDDVRSLNAFYLQPGHIDVETQQLVTFFVVTRFDDCKASEPSDDGHGLRGVPKYLCQTCGVLKPALLDDAGGLDPLAFSREHTDHISCAANSEVRSK